MLKIKNEKGVTLVTLVITMILLTIVAAVSIDYAYDGISFSAEKRALTDLEEVKQAVMQKYTEFKQIGVDEDEGSYLNIADELSVSSLSKYASVLEHEYSDDTEVDPSKKYYTMTTEQLEEIGIETRTNPRDVEGVTIKTSSGETILYIVNFYYGEVLNVHLSSNFKTEHSGKSLHTIGRTVEPTTESEYIAEAYWGESSVTGEYDGLEFEVELEETVSPEYSYYFQGNITINITNNSSSDKVISLMELETEADINSQWISNGANSYYTSTIDNKIITINYNSTYYKTITSGETYTIVLTIQYSGRPTEPVCITNVEFQ